MSIITEIVTMKTVPGIAADEFINIVDCLERDYHSKQSGFIDTELLYNDKSNEWIMVQHWASKEQQNAASAKMFKDENAASFVKVLEPTSVKMSILPQIKTWG